MADNEIRIISKVIRDKDIKPAIDRGIQSDWFVNPQAKVAWNFILEHWKKYGQTPTPVTVKDVLPGFQILDVQESFDYLLDAFCEWRVRGLTEELIQHASLAIEAGDYDLARETVARELAMINDQANQGVTYDVDLTKTVVERIDYYLSLRDLPDGLLGLPTGFPTIDKATLGLQPQQLVTLVATPKVGKSSVMLAMAKNIWERGKVVLFISFEMSNEEQTRRFDSMITNIAHYKLQTGQIDNHDESILRRRLGLMGEADNPIHLVADPTSTSSVSGVVAKIEQYHPDVVMIDGVYLMRDEISGEHNTPTALTNITRAMKRVAQNQRVPILQSTQALTWKLGRGKKLTGDSVGYSSSFFQDSDVLLGLQDVDDEEPCAEERLLRVLASRNCGRIDTTIIFDWNTGTFAEYEE